ncbi:MAG: Rieske (2Fe-2S) protein [Legionellales bacterium]|nr:Rieske (2Fe-2S) protein [Legionellales bacterium]
MNITWFPAINKHDIADQQWKIVSINNLDLAIINLGGEFFAIEDYCTHTGCPFIGEPIENETLVCPWHGARFAIRSGEVLEPPAYENLHTFPVKIEQDQIFVGFESK